MASNRPTIALIGAGNMGSALISGLIARHHPARQLYAADPSKEKLAALHKKFAIQVSTSNEEAIENAEAIIFAVKPQFMGATTKALAPLLQKTKALVISIAAGIREERIQQWLGGGLAIVRGMPNTPALIGCGASALYANALATPSQRTLAESILNCVGLTIWLEDEKQMDAVTALSGSGPAYFFLMIEALQQAGQDLGLAPETARLLTLQTAYGAARLALESGEKITDLRLQVTSPGGTTERALRVLEEGELRRLMLKAVTAAKNRAEELAEGP